MPPRLRLLLARLRESFWLLPAVMVVLASALALVCLHADAAESLPSWLAQDWLYDGGGTGARTLLGAIASSAIGVAGTVFSITIAALSLAAGQMGPRLLRNFVSDRGNQATLGTFIGTFAYALLVLRSVRGQDEGDFVPHLSLTVGMLLAFVCVGMLVYFVGHMARRINVDTVIELVSEDLREALAQLAADEEPTAAPSDLDWRDAAEVVIEGRGYVQHIDEDGLADWAAQEGVRIRLLLRRGDFLFPGAPAALVSPPHDGSVDALARSLELGSLRGGPGDAEHAVRQLVEVGVRALSSGINDPQTANSVLDRLGVALCDLRTRCLPSGVVWRKDTVRLVVPSIDYDSLLAVMFHTIRQNAAGSVTVLIRMLEVMTAVASCERGEDRRQALARHARLVLDGARRTVLLDADLASVHRRYQLFEATLQGGARASVGADRDARVPIRRKGS